ncbi:MAG: M20/M25/M40 family metallo-hydrolase [Oscillospiraceae bacterium]|nr:M20/M25/M40 family metallo-hydrolase [Oscillospiraceae bacterium]
MGWWIGLGVLILLAGLLGAACVRAALLKNPEKRGEPQPVDGEKAAKYAKDLSRMIRCETISVRESGPAEKFARYRAELEQLFPLVHERLERTLIGDAMLFKWRGTDPARGAVVLMAHSDVVPAAGEWDHPPFAGEIADGCVWGRGAMDTKGSLCALFNAVEELLAEGYTPPCDVYLASSNNEEIMGDGAPNTVTWLTDHGVKLDLVLDEGGAVIEAPMPGLNGKYAMLGVLEKGYADVRFTAVSAGGHSSTPPKGTPLARLAAFVNRVETRPPFPVKITPPVKAMFAAMAPDMAFPFRLLFGNLWLFGPLLKRVIPKVSGQAGALLHTTCAFTMAQGSDAPNVIPAQASVTANLRFMVHQGREASLQALEKLANKYGLRMEVLYACDCSPVVDVHSAGYAYIRQCVREVFPEAGIAPYVMLGGTDAKHYAKVCDCALRFAPTVLTPQQLASMHASNENLSVDALARAVAFYRRVLTGYR